MTDATHPCTLKAAMQDYNQHMNTSKPFNLRGFQFSLNAVIHSKRMAAFRAQQKNRSIVEEQINDLHNKDHWAQEDYARMDELVRQRGAA